MGSLLLLLFIAVILAVLVWIVIKVPWWAKPLIIIGAFLAVTADGYLGRRKLEKMCQEQGGLHIYKTVNNVEGFELNNYPEKHWLEKYSYSFIEGISSINGKIDRLVMKKDGTITTEKGVSRKSKYLIKFFPDDENIGYYFYDRYKIINKENNKTLATYTIISYSGGWIDRLLSSLYASKSFSYCSNFQSFDMDYWNKTIVAVLKPKKEEK